MHLDKIETNARTHAHTHTHTHTREDRFLRLAQQGTSQGCEQSTVEGVSGGKSLVAIHHWLVQEEGQEEEEERGRISRTKGAQDACEEQDNENGVSVEQGQERAKGTPASKCTATRQNISNPEKPLWNWGTWKGGE